MELKSTWLCPLWYRQKVLIVPLWNWNAARKSFAFAEEGFNRTFMELKLDTIYNYINNQRSFNRTFMELK